LAKLTNSIEIEASPEKVFAFVISEKMNDVWKDSIEAKWKSEGPVGVGSIGHFKGNPNFIKGEWDMEVIEFEKNKKMTMLSIGKSPMNATTSVILEPTSKGTKLTYVQDYKVPYSVLGKLVDKVKVSKDMDKNAKKMNANLKKTLEA
jgi:carbon monoxide dehydrogenase subunit G